MAFTVRAGFPLQRRDRRTRMHLMAVSVDTAPASALVRVNGEIDVFTAGQLRSAIARAMDDGCHDITVDLGGVSFMDCAGVNALLWCRKHLRTADGRLSLGRVSPRAERILTLAGLMDQLTSSEPAAASPNATHDEEHERNDGQDDKNRPQHGEAPSG